MLNKLQEAKRILTAICIGLKSTPEKFILKRQMKTSPALQIPASKVFLLENVEFSFFVNFFLRMETYFSKESNALLHALQWLLLWLQHKLEGVCTQVNGKGGIIRRHGQTWSSSTYIQNFFPNASMETRVCAELTLVKQCCIKIYQRFLRGNVCSVSLVRYPSRLVKYPQENRNK